MTDFERLDRPNLDPELVEVADLLWEQAHGAPPLEQDPVAVKLGLVPDEELPGMWSNADLSGGWADTEGNRVSGGEGDPK